MGLGSGDERETIAGAMTFKQYKEVGRCRAHMKNGLWTGLWAVGH